MAKGKAYWEGRTEQLFNAQDKRNATLENKLGKEYKRTAAAIDKDIASYYAKYSKDDVVQYRKLVKRLNKSERDLLYQNYDAFVDKYPQHAHLMPVRKSIYKLNRLEGLQLSTRQNMLELGAIEQVEFDKAMRKAYGQGYLSTMRGLQNSEAFFSVQDEILEQTLNERWINGENFSDRIWGNKQKLINTLNTEVRDAFIRQDSYAKMKGILQHRAGVGAYEARRLVETEAAFIMNQANGQAFQDDGIKSYENSAVLDSKTSEICEAMNGEQFLFTEARVSENYPPYHSFCRTIIIPVEVGDEKPREKTDEERSIVNAIEEKQAESQTTTSTANDKKAAENTLNELRKELEDTKKQAGIKDPVYTAKQIDEMDIKRLRSAAKKISKDYYLSGKSGISFGDVDIDTAVDNLVSQGSKTSLRKDIKSMQRKLKEIKREE